jgi:hypothetical protein
MHAGTNILGAIMESFKVVCTQQNVDKEDDFRKVASILRPADLTGSMSRNVDEHYLVGRARKRWALSESVAVAWIPFAESEIQSPRQVIT